MQQFEVSNMPNYSIIPIAWNKLHLQSRRVVDPIMIEDVPPSMTKAGMNEQFQNPVNTMIPIIKDFETPTETLTEIHVET